MLSQATGMWWTSSAEMETGFGKALFVFIFSKDVPFLSSAAIAALQFIFDKTICSFL